jgi:hypothetical protein
MEEDRRKGWTRRDGKTLRTRPGAGKMSGKGETMSSDIGEEDDLEECPECSGRGWVDDPSDGGTMTCPSCGGEGEV